MKSLVTVGSFGAKIAIVITATVGGTALVGSSVFASLTATANNTSAHSVTSGTLKLTQAASGVAGLTAGFATAVTAIAPGDTINRYIDLSNGGTLDGASMTLKVADANTSTLTSSALTGLAVVVKECTVPYTTVTGICSGSETTVLTTTANALLTPLALPVAAADLVAGAVSRLHFLISLPASSEITTNGTLPGSSIQGATALLTWTITETQRNGTNTVA
jgi:spore coat-associated protein N